MRKYTNDNKSGLYLPNVQDVFIYIDDGGLEEWNYTGYTTLLIDEFASQSLESKIRDILKTYNAKLHAHEISSRNVKKYTEVYRALFDETYNQMSKANICVLCNYFNNSSVLDNFSKDYRDFFESVLRKLGQERVSEDHIKYITHISVPLFEFFERLSGDYDPEVNLKIVIDRKGSFDVISTEWFMLYSKLQDLRESTVTLINRFTEVVLGKPYKIASLDVVDSSKNIPIGIVDAISNFSFNYIKYVMNGSGSKTETMKYNIFKEFLSKSDTNLAEVDDNIKSNLQFSGNQIVSPSGRFISLFYLATP